MRQLLICLLLIAILPARATWAQSMDELIRALGDSDSQRRANAEIELKRLGEPARQALIVASHQPGDPAIASAAARVLLAMPWATKDDHPSVKIVLGNYGQGDESQRIKSIGLLTALQPEITRNALLRILVEDPSEDVCWQVVKNLRMRWSRELGLQLRTINPPETRSAAAMLVGFAWKSVDREKSLEWYRKSIQIEAFRPSNDDGELATAFEELADVAVGAGLYDRAAEIRRQQAARISLSQDADAMPLYQLFVLHGRFGPLKGLAQDVQDFRDYLGDPGVLYGLSRAYARAGRDLEAMALETAARSATIRMSAHFKLAWFFSRIGWEDVARQEAYAVSSAAVDEENPFNYLFRAKEILATLASHADDDATAIEHLKGQIAVMESIPGAVWRRADDLFGIEYVRVQIAWREARMALARNDEAAARKSLDELMSLNTTDQSDAVLNATPLLKAAGRQAEADELFQITYAKERAKLERDPENATQMNDLAWLCARCDQKLDEALALSTRAVELDPENSAFLDTLAEVQLRRGNAAEALKLETRALDFRPEDTFMLRQQERFRAAAATTPVKVP